MGTEVKMEMKIRWWIKKGGELPVPKVKEGTR
jgi:hypothetical protein